MWRRLAFLVGNDKLSLKQHKQVSSEVLLRENAEAVKLQGQGTFSFIDNMR